MITTTLATAVCPKCGILQKSGKLSCCGRGGSWSGRCGKTGNTNFGHTWYQGIQVCKSYQLQLEVRQQVYAQRKSDFSDNDASDTMSMLMPGARPISAPANTSIITSDRTSIAHGTRATSSKVIIKMTTAIINGLVIPVPAATPVNSTIIYKVNPAITPQADLTINKSMASAPAHAFMTISSQISASTAREYDRLFHIITHININLLFVFVCWY